MKKCVDIKSGEYQQLKLAVGNSLSNFKFHAYVQAFFTEHNRLPKLHEIPGASSMEYLLKTLQAKEGPEEGQYKVTRDALLQYTNEEIQRAIQVINGKHTDLIVDYMENLNDGSPIQLDGNYYLTIKQKPSYKSYYKEYQQNKEIPKENGKLVLGSMIRDLRKKYGIPIVYADTEELNALLKSELSSNAGIDLKTAKGFVLNGKIYINSSIADLDTPIHELFHLFVGAIKYQDKELYKALLRSVEEKLRTVENWEDKLAGYYKNRTRNDILEEVLVSDYANWLTNTGSSILFDNISENEQNALSYEILNNIQLMLDRMLFGQQSTTSLSREQLYVNSLSGLINVLGSNVADMTSICALAGDHHRLANTKQYLMENDGPLKLKEECE